MNVDELTTLKAYARDHPMSLDALKNTLVTGEGQVERDSQLETLLDNGYRVVYTVEEQPIGFCHHVSISKDNGTPDPAEVNQICKALDLGLEMHFEKLVAIKTDKFATWFESGTLVRESKDFTKAFNLVVPDKRLKLKPNPIGQNNEFRP